MSTGKELALHMLREATLDREFKRAPECPTFHECMMCFAVVTERSRQSHMDWHDEVYGKLKEVADMLRPEQ